MSKYSLSHLSDSEVLRGLAAHVEQERQNSAKVRDILAEAGARGLDLSSEIDPESTALADTCVPLAPGEPPRPTRMIPLGDGRVMLEFTISRDTYDMMRYVQSLLADEMNSPTMCEVFVRALKAAIEEEKAGR